MAFIEKFSDKEQVEIELARLVAFTGYPFKSFEKGKRYEDAVDEVGDRGICHPILVRSTKDDKYEILDGHYRVAAAKKLRIERVPALILDNLTEEEVLFLVSDTNPVGLLVKHGIDIDDNDYKNIESMRVFCDDQYSMALDEYIERILLDPPEVQRSYESIYDMGNSYILNEKECEYDAIGREIVRVMYMQGDSNVEKEWERPSKYQSDMLAARAVKEAQAEEDEERVRSAIKQIKDYGRQFKKYLDFDIDSFDYDIIQNKRERAKILYFFYVFKHREFKEYNVLELLSKPSMENIDNSFLGWETSNGRIIKAIKHAVEKEITLELKRNIKNAVRVIVDGWGDRMINIRLLMEDLPEYEDDFRDEINLLKEAMAEPFNYKKDFDSPYLPPTPLETLYLRLVQHEYLGQMKDLLMIYDMQAKKEYNVPAEYVEEMKKFETRYISEDDIDTFFEAGNIRKIAKFVYLKSEINKEERKEIVRCKEKVKRFLEFCLLFDSNTMDDVTELLIISCLQAIIIGEKKEIFDYAFHGYEGKRRGRHNKKSVQAALANDERTYDALQMYWVNIVVNRSYANVGKDGFRKNYREVERLFCSVIAKILNFATVEEMYSMNSSYLDLLY